MEYNIDEKITANGFCNYFTNIGTKLEDIIPKGKYMYKHFMNKTQNPNSIYFSPTCHNEIVQSINKMKKKKSYGRDDTNIQSKR